MKNEQGSKIIRTDEDLVSIVIPCFNASFFLRKTIESVLDQTYDYFQIIIVDDKSTDDSVDIINSYAKSDSRVILIQMAKNAGSPAAPRNIGVAAAQGKWIAFLDADDIWHPRKLEFQMYALHQHQAFMCSTQMKDFRDEQEILFTEPRSHLAIQRITRKMQLFKYRTPTSSIVIRRDVMLCNPFNENPSYKAREDTDCFIRVHEDMDYSIKIIYPLMFYRLQAMQISGNKWAMISRHLAVLKKYRTKSGKGLGIMAYIYTITHFFSSIYLRLILKRL